MDFIKESTAIVNDIETYIARLNKIVRQGNLLESMSNRIDLAILICDKIESGQSVYLRYSEQYMYDTQITIDFDYKISAYANRMYIFINDLLSFFALNRTANIRTRRDFNTAEFLEKLNIVYALHRRMLGISARWSIERYMNLLDYDLEQRKRKLPRRLPLLRDVIPCFDRIVAVKMGIHFDDGFNIRRLVVCVPPKSGKTYCANIYTILMLAHHAIRFKETGIIRMTNTAPNAQDYGSQVNKMMTSPTFLEVFPEFKKYVNDKGEIKLFAYESTEKYLLKDCSSECPTSIYMFGREAAINGKRSKLGAVIDDMSNGVDEMDNDEAHKRMTDKVMSDVLDRSDDDDCPLIIMGTMYNENDVQNEFIKIWENIGLIQHPKMRSVKYTTDGLYAICLVDVEDENGNSIAPDLYPNSTLAEKRLYFQRRNKPYMYNLIYRQIRDSREPKTFEYDSLLVYDKLPKTLEEYSKCVIDTTRQNGQDYFSQPFLVFNPKDGLYYLTDVIFEQKSLGLLSDPKNEFRDKICRRIITNNAVECCIENNTSNVTGVFLKERCYAFGYKNCKFRERYTAKRGKYSSKTTRILDMEETIKNNIVFPSRNAQVSTQMYAFMQQLTNWSSKAPQGKGNPDDAPDSITMFAEEYLFKNKRYGTIGSVCNISQIL